MIEWYYIVYKCVGWSLCDHASGDVFAAHGLVQHWRMCEILCRSSVALREEALPRSSNAWVPLARVWRWVALLLAYPLPGLVTEPTWVLQRKTTQRKKETLRFEPRKLARAVRWALDVTTWWLNNECGISSFTWSQGHGPWLEKRRGERDRKNREGKKELNESLVCREELEEEKCLVWYF